MACPAGFTMDAEPHQVTPFAAATEMLRPGDRFQYWDYDTLWTRDHYSASQLEHLRLLGDDLADNALKDLGIKRGQDSYKALMEYTMRPRSEQESPAPRLLLENMMAVPNWVDWEKVGRGQAVFRRYSLFMIPALFHFSLAGGFSVPKVAKVLNSTGYIIGSKSRKRIFETTQFVLDVLNSLEYIQPGGPSWASILQIRLLHANVHARLHRISHAHSKIYSVEKHGVPINQEDLIFTLFSFSNSNWGVMEKRMNVKMSVQERDDYLHLWRYLGNLMGINDVLGVMTSPKRADACQESIILHLVDPDVQSGKMCMDMLKQVTPPPRMVTTLANAVGIADPAFGIHMAVSEYLFGEEFWALSELSPVPWPYRWIWSTLLSLMKLDLWVATHSHWWLELRTMWVIWYVSSCLPSEIGNARTEYALKEVPRDRNVFADGRDKREP